MTRQLVYFSRHGQTDWNVEGRIQGQMDIDINRHGRDQADRNGDCLLPLVEDADGFDFVASPLRRTRETMQRIRARMHLDADDFRTDPLLMEVNFGDWQGFTLAEIDDRDPGVTRRRAGGKWDFLPPGKTAENYEILSQRMRSWLDTVTGPTVCVTHGGNMRTLFHIVESLGGNDAANLVIPQDRVLRLEGGKLDWL